MPEAPSAARRRRRLAEQVRAVALGVGFPFVLILLWDRAVAITGTRLVPSPREVAVMMYDFSRSEEHTSELQSRLHLVCRLLLEKKKKNQKNIVECMTDC